MSRPSSGRRSLACRKPLAPGQPRPDDGTVIPHPQDRPMYSTSCPGCGVKVNYRADSVGTGKKCVMCGKAFVLPPPPPFPWSGCLAAAGLFGAGALLLLCCLPVGLVALFGPRTEGRRQSTDADAPAVAARRPTEPDSPGPSPTRPAPATEPGPATPLQDPAKPDADADARADAEAEAERLEEEMARFEIEAKEYHADNMVRLARRLAAETFKLEDAVKRYQQIVKDYPGTQAAADAELLLARKPVPDHPRPPYPVLPEGITKTDPHPLLGQYEPPKDKSPPGKTEPAALKTEREKVNPPTPLPDLNPAPPVILPPPRDPGKTVYVRGYTRKDGTYVHPHYRRPPGSKR